MPVRPRRIVVDGYIDWSRFPACNFGNAPQKGFAEMQPPRVEAEVARGELELGPPIPAAASPATPGIDRQVDATPTWPRTQAVGTRFPNSSRTSRPRPMPGSPRVNDGNSNANNPPAVLDLEPSVIRTPRVPDAGSPPLERARYSACACVSEGRPLAPMGVPSAHGAHRSDSPQRF